MTKLNNITDIYNINLLKGIIICKDSGEYLVDLILDSDINPILLSSFVGALSLFGKDSLGKIEEIMIKGLNVEMVIVSKHKLILIAIMDKSFNKYYLREEAKRALDNFYAFYKNDIDECYDISKFESFKKILLMQIIEYFDKIKDRDNKQPIEDFGFFTEAIKKMKKQKIEE
ncbi:MAG: hypothetical protein KGD63_09315 [Candidatus Lokiarchaeota archaeon]|nr:hypothetical protein [Candidatus Lokiarchaeota archaeon]